MPITSKKPFRRVGVGSMYVCFADQTSESGYETDVTKTANVVTIGTTENRETTNIWASNQIYDTDISNEPPTLAVENIAFDPITGDRMRGSEVDGAFSMDGNNDAPEEFAFGIVFPKTNGHYEYVWYPNCKATNQTDDAQTKDDSGSNTQNPTTTIQAYPYDDEGHFRVRYDTSKVPEGEAPLTEEEFFEQVLLAPIPAA